MNVRRAATIAPVLLVLNACGGAIDSDLFGNGSDAAAVKDTSTVDVTTTNDGGIGPGPDASFADATPIVDATPIFDVTPIDAGPVDPGTACPTQPQQSFCKNDTELCCLRQTGSACIQTSSANTCFNGVRMFCDNTDSCKTGEVCCGNITNQGGQGNFYTEVKCSATCSVSATAVPGQRRFCNPNNKPDECQQYGMTCKASGLLPGYFVCGN